jgi:hypothetical protein
MLETAAHLGDHVSPHLPVRHWVLSVPKRLLYFTLPDGAVLCMMLRIFLRVSEPGKALLAASRLDTNDLKPESAAVGQGGNQAMQLARGSGVGPTG